MAPGIGRRRHKGGRGSTTRGGRGSTTRGGRGSATCGGRGGSATCEGRGGSATSGGHGGSATSEGRGGSAISGGRGDSATSEGRGGSATSGGRGSSATSERHGGSATSGGRGSVNTEGGLLGFGTRGGRGGSTSSRGCGVSLAQGRREDSTSGGRGGSPTKSTAQGESIGATSSQTLSTAEPTITNNAIRGPTRGVRTIATARASIGGKLSIVFDAECRQPICVNAERFNNDIGFIVRNHGSFAYKEWRVVPEDVRAPLREYLLESFDIDLGDKTTLKCIDEQMRKAWKGHKYKLHNYFKDIGGLENVEMAKRKPHPDLSEEQQGDWEMLCDHWSSEKFQEWSTKNTEARSKRKWGSRNGSVSTQRYHIRRGESLTSPTGQIETWRERHYDPENGWISSDLESVYDVTQSTLLMSYLTRRLWSVFLGANLFAYQGGEDLLAVRLLHLILVSLVARLIRS